MSEQKHQNNEVLSAFIDTEQSDIEMIQTIDALLNDSEYKERYIRTQLMNEYLHDQVQVNIINTELRSNISLALDDLPAHFVDEAVILQSGKTGDVSKTNWFNTFIENRVLSGMSIAASVMFITLFTLQAFDLNTNNTNSMNENLFADIPATNSGQAVPNPPLIRVTSDLPATFASTDSVLIKPEKVNNESTRQQYQWIEADPLLSKQVRQYINEHEIHRAAYNLQPKIRTATYQIND